MVSGFGSSLIGRFIAAVDQQILEHLQLGIQVAISIDNNQIVNYAHGEARAGVPMTTDSMLTWFSMTKPTVVVAIAQLWEKGELDLDDKVSRFVLDFGAEGKSEITIRHLLTHTGGFRPGDQVTSNAGSAQERWHEIVKGICKTPIEPGWIPGKRAGYHLTSGMTMLGEIVRKIDGRFFDAYVREEIFLPLGMDDCYVGMPKKAYESMSHRIGSMHDTSKGVAIVLDTYDSQETLESISPGAGGIGPMNQLNYFWQMLCGKGTRGNVQILRPPTVEALTAPQRIDLIDETSGTLTRWSLGFNVDSVAMGGYCSRRTYGHGGSRSSMSFCDPEIGLVVNLLTNGMPGNNRHYLRFNELSSLIYEDLGFAVDSARHKLFPK